jgi:hypothetical protein
MNKNTFVFHAFLLALSLPASALEWQAMGPRALGMGGAGVALTQGPLASYWNPAALGRATENSYGLAIPVGFHAALTGTVIEGAKNLEDLKNKTSPSATEIQDALNKLNDPNNGLRVNALTGANLKIGKIAFFANGFIDAGATPVVDLVNTSQNNITQGTNNSKLIVKGARLIEFGAGYGHELPMLPGLFLGGNLKIMSAQVGYADYLILQNNNSDSDVFKKLKDGAKTSSNFGVDIGALWDVTRTFENAWWHPRVGLVGRNLNNPKFKLPAAATAAGYVGHYSVNPQLRLGGSISPLNWWHIASDIDLTNNVTSIGTISSRQFGLGTEVDVFNRTWINIPLRAGISRNLANTSAGTMVTLGAGLNFMHVMLDVSGQYSPQTIQIQSQDKNTKIPKEFGGALQLSFLFGGSNDERARDLQPVPTQQIQTAPAPATPTETLPQQQPTPAQTLPPAQVEQIKANAEKAQQDLSKEAAKPDSAPVTAPSAPASTPSAATTPAKP